MDEITRRLESVWKSERLVYRALEDTDAAFVHNAIRSDPVNVALGGPPLLAPLTKKESEQDVSRIIEACMLSVVICLPDNTPIGYLGLAKQNPRMIPARQTAMAIQIASEFQDKGYGKEAVNWALDWAFRQAGVHRVSIETMSFNERAFALYKKIGFVEEGRKRESFYLDMQWWDSIQLGMLEDEWKSLRKIK
ncbi:acyl-CoA N-acyltransferase [Xylariales sp. PMI_506]|nr:acyl-CoA N-acyltransferase [Xylariales sp. PMI_506]